MRRLLQLTGTVASILCASCRERQHDISSCCSEQAHSDWLALCMEIEDGDGRYGSLIPSAPRSTLPAEFTRSCKSNLLDKSHLPPSLSGLYTRWFETSDCCGATQHKEWLEACYGDTMGLVGRPRADLLSKFSGEGGLSTREDRRFIHNRCRELHVKVVFEEAGTPGYEEDERDIVRSVEAYIGPVIMD